MASLREKLAILLAAGIIVVGIKSPEYARQLPEETLEEEYGVDINSKYQAFLRAQAEEERKGKQEPDYQAKATNLLFVINNYVIYCLSSKICSKFLTNIQRFN